LEKGGSGKILKEVEAF